MSADPVVRIEGEAAVLVSGRQERARVSVRRLVEELARGIERGPSCGVLPDRVRLWSERGDCVGLAIELPPGPRTVRVLREDSKSPFGPSARYREATLSFPWVVLPIVFHRGALTGMAQLYYRTRPLAEGSDLLFPNLYNVARGYGLPCWLCLANLGDVSSLPWPAKVHAIVDHVFGAGWNRSSEVHEGNSYWGSTSGLDPRVASIEAWEAATREQPMFACQVQWKAAGSTIHAELERMARQLGAGPPIENAAQLAGCVTRAAAGASAR